MDRTRRPPEKVPSWNLTGAKSTQYVKEANIRSKLNKEKAGKENAIKKRWLTSTGQLKGKPQRTPRTNKNS